MTTKRKSILWDVLRGTWLVSAGGIVSTVTALATIYFLFPAVANAVGLSEGAALVGEAATAIETAADGSIVRMLLIALIISLVTQGACVWLMFRLIYKTASKPCVLSSQQGSGVIRDTLWEIWRDMKARIQRGEQ